MVGVFFILLASTIESEELENIILGLGRITAVKIARKNDFDVFARKE